MTNPPPARLRLDDHLCFALYTASRAFTRAYRPLLAELGLTYPQYVTLLALWEQDDQSVRELGDRLALDSGTLTPLLKRLEESKLIRKERSSDDERVVRVRLTAAGKKLEARAREIPQALACRAGFDLEAKGARELGKLREALKALTTSLNASCEDEPAGD